MATKNIFAGVGIKTTEMASAFGEIEPFGMAQMANGRSWWG